MTSGLASLATLTASALTAWSAWKLAGADPVIMRSVGRGAMFFGWTTLIYLIGHNYQNTSNISPPALDIVVASSLWCLAGLTLITRAQTAFYKIATAVLALSSLIAALLFVYPDDTRGTFPYSVAVSWFLTIALTEAMIRRRHPALRTIAHAIVLFSTIAIILPGAVLWQTHALNSVPRLTPLRAMIAIVSSLCVIAIAVPSCAEFIRAGGTPDPLDPPSHLLTRGIYAHLRHPLQIAESLAVITSAVLCSTRWMWIYAFAFTATLLGPMRVLEEILLHQRWGNAAESYRNRVAGMFPHFRRAREITERQG